MNRAARRQAARASVAVLNAPRYNTKPEPGPNRADRRLKKYHPDQYADIEFERDPAVRRTLARRWNFIFSKAPRSATKERTPVETP